MKDSCAGVAVLDLDLSKDSLDRLDEDGVGRRLGAAGSLAWATISVGKEREVEKMRARTCASYEPVIKLSCKVTQRSGE